MAAGVEPCRGHVFFYRKLADEADVLCFLFGAPRKGRSVYSTLLQVRATPGLPPEKGGGPGVSLCPDLC